MKWPLVTLCGTNAPLKMPGSKPVAPMLPCVKLEVGTRARLEKGALYRYSKEELIAERWIGSPLDRWFLLGSDTKMHATLMGTKK